MPAFATLIIGLVFGSGILISGMANPFKVISFFEFNDRWDPGFGLSIVSAVVVTAIGYRLVLRRATPFMAPLFHIPSRQDIDIRLIAGSLIFGVGWAISGLSPGAVFPALGITLGTRQIDPLLFLLGFISATAAVNLVKERTAR